MRHKSNGAFEEPDELQYDLEAFKKFMGPLIAEYSDKELRQLQRDMCSMAEILVELYLMKRKAEGQENKNAGT